MHMPSVALGNQQRTLDALRLEVLAVVRHLTWVLGTEQNLVFLQHSSQAEPSPQSLALTHHPLFNTCQVKLSYVSEFMGWVSLLSELANHCTAKSLGLFTLLFH